METAKYLLLALVCGMLSSAGQEVFAANRSAFDQLIDAAGKQPGAVPDPGPPVCAECSGKNGRHLSTCSIITGKNKPSTMPNLITVGSLARQNAKEKAAVEEVERLTREVEKSDASIATSQGHIAKAKELGRIDWEDKARKNLRKAEHAKKITLEKLRVSKLYLDRIKKDKQRLNSNMDKGHAKPGQRGVVGRATGNVTMHSASDFGAKKFSAGSAGQLEPGDEIRTGSGGSAELQLLGGRGLVTMGENSRFRIEEDAAGAEVVRTIEGKFHFAVEKVAAFETALVQELSLMRDQLAIDSKDAYTHLMKRAGKKFQVRTPTAILAVRGTEFLVTESPGSGSELTVIEGSVAMSEPRWGKELLLGAGQRVAISPEGKLSEVFPVDPAALNRWWEEQP